MKWWPGLAISVACLAGCCQTPRGPSDPFLRTTVPPPQTGQFAPPPGAYYAPGAPAMTPAAPGAMTVAPGSPAPAYGGAPVGAAPAYGTPPANYGAPPPTFGAPPAGMPDGSPATPSSTPSRYAPPGSFNFQSSLDRSKAVGPSLSQGAGPTLARSPAPSSRLANGPQTGSPADGVAQASSQDTSAPSDESPQSALAAPAVAIVPQLAPPAVEQASFVPPAAGADAASDSPLSAGAPTTTASPSAVASASVPEITDLPAATGSDTLRAYGTSRSRLVFTRANRPVSPSSSAVPGADINGASALPCSGLAASGADGPSVARPAGASRSSYAVADNYGTLYGKLEYSQALRQWKLRYIPIDGQTDSYGGSVLLPDAAGLGNFQPGDFVVVRGQVASAGPKRGFSPEYDLQQITMQ